MELDGWGGSLADFGFEEDLIRMLLGPCAGVGLVTLDPRSTIVSLGIVGLVSIRAGNAS